MAKKSEYGKPTFVSAVKNQLGMDDDGYGNSYKKKALQPKPTKTTDVSIGSAVSAIKSRKEQLAQYRDGGKVKKRKHC
jgi:hypothetical protein